MLVYISEAAHHELKRIAFVTGRKLQEVMNDAVTEYLKRVEKEK